MKGVLHITVTIIIMLIVSGFLVRIADATVQTGEDIGILAVLLVTVNALIGTVAY
ncbi:MAG: hypothetical protein ILA55_07265 [Erysipelotrichaceae bacterium]|nr:hypothetical protein [Erysipelotrichaceae bacterium]MBQ2233421.1 hypothetical protein [Erysipelotrichaceae bacterium]MBQ2504804.1 hypothetical protein [Erysipelotrichaceae bacterium]MBQ3962818.1 hypothetical protein [Erysipelotrichaceae bacterium]MBQ5554744.1 hypothetical protein [Erysipelotrichaceae bacterium]